MIRAALVAAVSLLVAVILLWFGYGEVRSFVKRTGERLRAMRQARDFRRLTPQWQAIVRALDPGAVPRPIPAVIPRGHPRLHQ
jgi:hypothetical protein